MKIKNILKIVVVSGMLAPAMTSCSDWLQVDLEDSILESALLNTGLFSQKLNETPSKEITVAHLFEAGLTGTANSAEKRRSFLQKEGLPARLTGKNLLSVLNSFYTYEEFIKKAGEISSD